MNSNVSPMENIYDEILDLNKKGLFDIPNEWFYYPKGIGRYGSMWNGKVINDKIWKK